MLLFLLQQEVHQYSNTLDLSKGLNSLKSMLMKPLQTRWPPPHADIITLVCMNKNMLITLFCLRIFFRFISRLLRRRCVFRRFLPPSHKNIHWPQRRRTRAEVTDSFISYKSRFLNLSWTTTNLQLSPKFDLEMFVFVQFPLCLCVLHRSVFLSLCKCLTVSFMFLYSAVFRWIVPRVWSILVSWCVGKLKHLWIEKFTFFQ